MTSKFISTLFILFTLFIISAGCTNTNDAEVVKPNIEYEQNEQLEDEQLENIEDYDVKIEVDNVATEDNIEVETKPKNNEGTESIKLNQYKKDENENEDNEDEDVKDVNESKEQEESEPESEPEEPKEMAIYFTERDVIALAKVLYNECRGVPSDVEKACVAWIACNRVDAGYADTVYEVVTAPHQFAYGENTPVMDDLYNLALDVLTRWNKERNGYENVGRVLPTNYLWFHGDGVHNYFRNGFSGNFNTWDYSLNNPYED